jgi:hypothetical protein
MEGKTQGSIIVAPEGFYVIRALTKKLNPEDWELEIEFSQDDKVSKNNSSWMG